MWGSLFLWGKQVRERLNPPPLRYSKASRHIIHISSQQVNEITRRSQKTSRDTEVPARNGRTSVPDMEQRAHSQHSPLTAYTPTTYPHIPHINSLYAVANPTPHTHLSQNIALDRRTVLQGVRTPALHYRDKATVPNRNYSAGGAGGRSPLAGARGVLASFPFSSPAAVGGTREIPE